MRRGSGRQTWKSTASLIVLQLKKPWNILSSGLTNFCLFICYLTDSLFESSLSVVSYFNGFLSLGSRLFSSFVRLWAQPKSVHFLKMTFFSNTTWNLTVYHFSSKYNQKIKTFFYSVIETDFFLQSNSSVTAQCVPLPLTFSSMTDW